MIKPERPWAMPQPIQVRDAHTTEYGAVIPAPRDMRRIRRQARKAARRTARKAGRI